MRCSRRNDPDRSLSDRVYKALLRAYPEGFRQECGAQMLQAFRDLCREQRRCGGMGGMWWLWARVVRDLATTAVAQRMDERKSDGEVQVRERRLAEVGFVLVLAPLFFVCASLMKYELGIGFLFDPLESLLSDPATRQAFNLISPVMFLGGLGVALVLNAYAVLRLNVGREDGAIVGTVRLEARFWNIAVVAVSLLLLVTLVGYFFAENFIYRP